MPAKERVVTALSMESNHFSTLLSMDSSSLSHDKSGREFNRKLGFAPPDINLPLIVSPSPLLPCSDEFVLDVGLAAQHHHGVVEMSCGGTKVGKKCAKRLDSVWGAWFFFNFYFKPAMNGRSKGKVVGRGSECDDKLDVFLVQHDMENIYMWVFKERPENALGKMQLRSYMNGHSRQGECPFPFSVEKGFVRSHRMQRKHYRGLSNPQCVHGIEIVRSPNLAGINEEERKKWMELTGRDLNFSIPPEASDFCSWRSVPTTEFVLERLPPLKYPKRSLNGSSLNLSTPQPNNVNGAGIDANKRKKMCFFPQPVDDDCFLSDTSHSERIEPPWLTKSSGVMRHAYGPVTAAKTIYEDDEGFLIIVSMPFVDLKRVKVTWRNTVSHGTVKISCTSTGCAPTIKRQNRTFQLADPSPEHCPPGEFVREIPLRTRIPEDAKLEAFGDETGTMLEILVPKHRVGPEEHEVRVCLRPSPWREQCVGLAEAIV